MVISLLFSVFGCFLVAQGATSEAEYCKHYPGDVGFSYSTTLDEYYWFNNYQNAYTSKKAPAGTYIYRRRTIITRRPRPHRPGFSSGFNSNMNAFNNINEVQQIQQVQQQIQGPFPGLKEDLEKSEHLNETEEEEEKQALPIWKITIPRQVSRVVVARIENGQVVDSFELNKTHFDNPNITTGSSHSSTSASQFSKASPSASTRIVDVTDQSIIPDAWYAICLDVNLVEKGKPHKCNRCTLLQARTDAGRQKFLDIDWEAGSFINTSAELRYSATDMPFAWATVRSKVWTKPQHPRCTANPEKVVFESKDFAYPDHFTYVKINNLIGKMAYEVQTDLDFPWKQEPSALLPQPFIVHDYLHGDSSNSLARCDDYSYTGE